MTIDVFTHFGIKGASRNALDFETRKPIDYVLIQSPEERVD